MVYGVSVGDAVAGSRTEWRDAYLDREYIEMPQNDRRPIVLAHADKQAMPGLENQQTVATVKPDLREGLKFWKNLRKLL